MCSPNKEARNASWHEYILVRFRNIRIRIRKFRTRADMILKVEEFHVALVMWSSLTRCDNALRSRSHHSLSQENIYTNMKNLL
jgi:hypothetical protein